MPVAQEQKPSPLHALDTTERLGVALKLLLSLVFIGLAAALVMSAAERGEAAELALATGPALLAGVMAAGGLTRVLRCVV